MFYNGPERNNQCDQIWRWLEPFGNNFFAQNCQKKIIKALLYTFWGLKNLLMYYSHKFGNFCQNVDFFVWTHGHSGNNRHLNKETIWLSDKKVSRYSKGPLFRCPVPLTTRHLKCIQFTVTVWIPNTWLTIHLNTRQYGCPVFKWSSHMTWQTIWILDILDHCSQRPKVLSCLLVCENNRLFSIQYYSMYTKREMLFPLPFACVHTKVTDSLSPQFCYLFSLFPYCIQNDVSRLVPY